MNLESYDLSLKMQFSIYIVRATLHAFVGCNVIHEVSILSLLIKHFKGLYKYVETKEWKYQNLNALNPYNILYIKLCMKGYSCSHFLKCKFLQINILFFFIEV